MTEIVRERDVVTIVKGETNPVMVTSALAQQGWLGGQGVVWADSPNDEFLVTYSDGTYGGFLLWGSNEDSDQFIAYQENQTRYQFATMCTGTWIMATRTYEHYTYASRQAGPLVAITYTAGDRLRFSLRGYWTSEDEWTLSGDPRGSNQFFVASVSVPPSAINKFYLTLHTSI